MKIETLKSKIQALSTGQLGSLGEQIFAHYVSTVLRQPLLSLHREGADFIYKSRKVDVGTTRKYMASKPRKTSIRGKDISVIFFQPSCLLLLPEGTECRITWSYVKQIYKSWIKKHRVILSRHQRHAYMTEYKAIKEEIITFFKSRGFECNVIRRSVTRSFGERESPGNLLIRKFKEEGIKVYIDFDGYKLTRDNIRFILAFPQSKEGDIPPHPSPSLKSKSPKIDLAGILKTQTHRCYFNNIKELQENFFNRYTGLRPTLRSTVAD